MKELVKINTNKHGKKLVSARELRDFLEVKTDFSNWCKRMFDYGMVDGKDYLLVKIGEQDSHGGSNKTDYALTVNCAKEISMIQRTDKGKQARQYFIECEKQLRIALSKPQTRFKNSAEHFKRLELNKHKVPAGHFSMLEEMIHYVIVPLDIDGKGLIDNCVPDSPLGRGFCRYLREEADIDTKKLPTYKHDFGDGRRTVNAKMYPDTVVHLFKQYILIWLQGAGKKYLTTRIKQHLLK